MTEIHPLRAAGIAVITAAALGSTFFASPAASLEEPATDTTCGADASSGWIFRNCDGPANLSAP